MTELLFALQKPLPCLAILEAVIDKKQDPCCARSVCASGGGYPVTSNPSLALEGPLKISLECSAITVSCLCTKALQVFYSPRTGERKIFIQVLGSWKTKVYL